MHGCDEFTVWGSYGAQLQHIQLEGEKIVAEVSSPEEAIAALRTNPEFIREVEELALNYIVR